MAGEPPALHPEEEINTATLLELAFQLIQDLTEQESAFEDDYVSAPILDSPPARRNSILHPIITEDPRTQGQQNGYEDNLPAFRTS